MKKYIQSILKAIGYYRLKSKWRWHQYITRLQKEDAIRKAKATAWIETIDHCLLPEVKPKDNITVSLTSHGKRVANFAPLAIYSIFQQTMLPNRIVLNIDETKWNDDNLPELIKKLQIAGLEVNFCEDVGPHTKLLPTLKKYPDDIVITVDDDIYYDGRLIAELYDFYCASDKKMIICREGRAIESENGKMIAYSKNPHASQKTNTNYIMPYGVAGVLYPSNMSIDLDIFDKSLIVELCPKADDIWFCIQEIRSNIQVKYIQSYNWSTAVPVDRNNEYSEDGSNALHFLNDEHNLNDVQWERVCSFYGL